MQKGLNLEQKNINADRATLASLSPAPAAARCSTADYADVLADHIPELNYKVTAAQQIGLFADYKDPCTRKTHWIFLGIFIVLVTAEVDDPQGGGIGVRERRRPNHRTSRFKPIRPLSASRLFNVHSFA